MIVSPLDFNVCNVVSQDLKLIVDWEIVRKTLGK